MRSIAVSSALRSFGQRKSLPISSLSIRLPSNKRWSSHQSETFEQFSERYTAFFAQAEDLFEVQRGLNNAFAYDLVPSPEVCEAAVRAARRCNDYATACRVFEAIKWKVENKRQYAEYIEQMKPLREELGISLQEELFPAES